MKIAIESNDGVTIKSPFDKTMGYIVCDVEEADIGNTEYIKIGDIEIKISSESAAEIKNKGQSKFSLRDCCTVITRGMDRENRSRLKKKGIDVFVTFNIQAKDALRAYLKERLINRPVFH